MLIKILSTRNFHGAAVDYANECDVITAMATRNKQ